MTPTEFHNAYRSTADQVMAGTGLDPIMLLSQWANETDWGLVVVGNNLANIRDAPGSFARYASLSEFANAYIWTMHNSRPNLNLPVSGGNNYYWAVMAQTNAVDQLQALCDSAWSIGHYGGSLQGFYAPLEEFELTPQQALDQAWIVATLKQMYYNNPADGGWPNWTKLQATADDTLARVKAIPGGGGTEPPEPVEPKTVTLNVPAQTVTGTIA